MTLRRTFLAAAFVLAGASAASAESAFEPRNAVPNAPTGSSERILQLSANPAGADYRADRRARASDRRFHRTRNSGFLHGYTTFNVLDSIR